MTKPTMRVHNVTTDEIIDREMTDDEYAVYLAQKQEGEARLNEQTSKDATKQAVLDKLGLSADEVAALLG